MVQLRQPCSVVGRKKSRRRRLGASRLAAAFVLSCSQSHFVPLAAAEREGQLKFTQYERNPGSYRRNVQEDTVHESEGHTNLMRSQLDHSEQGEDGDAAEQEVSSLQRNDGNVTSAFKNDGKISSDIELYKLDMDINFGLFVSDGSALSSVDEKGVIQILFKNTADVLVQFLDENKRFLRLPSSDEGLEGFSSASWWRGSESISDNQTDLLSVGESNRSSRRLVFYDEELPPRVDRIIHIPTDGLRTRDATPCNESSGGTCYLVFSTVTVFLSVIEDDIDLVRKAIVKEMRDSLAELSAF